jgi:hypothetical protein
MLFKQLMRFCILVSFSFVLIDNFHAGYVNIGYQTNLISVR